MVAWRRGIDFAGCKAGTARRRGVPFVRTRRRGLRSMSGHPAYAWGNPPTLRRSSFPQRASRPAGGPIPKHAWGCAPRPPNAQAAAGYERCQGIVRTAPQIRSQGACGAFYFWRSRDQIKNQPYKRRLAPDPGGRRPSGRGKWGPARSQDLVGRGGCTVAGRAARSKA